MTTPTPAVHSRALLMLVLATLFWGLSFPLVKTIELLHGQLLPGVGTWFSAIYSVAPRFVLGVVILIALRPRDVMRITRGEWKQGIIIGLFAAGGMLFQNDGLHFVSASTSAFLTQFYALLIPLWLTFRVRRNPGWLIWICCGLVLVGVAILGRFDWQEMRLGRGEWETLLCSLFFMGQILWLEKKEFSANRPERLTLVTFLTQAVVFCALAGVTAPNGDALLRPWTSGAWVCLMVVLTVVCTIGAYSLMNIWQPKITATEAGLIYCIEPIFAAVMALFLPAWLSGWAGVDYANERATWTLVLGGGLITLANVLLQMRPPVKDT